MITRDNCKEGFQDKASKGKGNVLINIVENVKRINKYLVNPTLWTDRIEMISMNPVELARREILKQRNQDKPKTQTMTE
jgi:hypothetical protein